MPGPIPLPLALTSYLHVLCVAQIYYITFQPAANYPPRSPTENLFISAGRGNLLA